MSVGFTRAPKNIPENTVEEFISRADSYNVSKDALPWIGLREDKRTELYNIRFTEVEMSKLRFISEHTPNSMQTFLIKHILPAIDRAVDDILLDIKRKNDSTDRSV